MERGGKASILGFYGFVPNVEIRVQDLTKPIDGLTVVLYCEPGQGDFGVLPQLLNPNGQVLAAPPNEVRLTLNDPAKRPSLVFGFGMVTLAVAGTYNFVLRVDGKEHYRAPFQVLQGESKDFL